jgi:peptidoglycan/LPS O-acetylase OafA/YrhL
MNALLGVEPARAGPATPEISSDAAIPRGGGRIGQIDTLRAFAMTAVIAQHCVILPFGWLGVWLFFVVSGFVVTETLMARKVVSGVKDRLFQFYVRRIVRIWPIYLAFCAVGFVVSSNLIGRLDWRPMASLVLFYNNVEVAFGNGFFAAWPAGQLWTISVEWQFYLVFGFAFILAPRRWLAPALMALVVLCPLARLAAGLFLETRLSASATAFAIYTFPGLHFDAFAMGCLLAMFGPRLGWRTVANRLTVIGCVALAAYCVTYVAINAAHGAHGINILTNVISGIIFGDHREVFLYSAIDLASVALVAIAVAGGGLLDPLLRQRWLQAVGRVSYGGYVYHSAVLALILWIMESLHFAPPGQLGSFERGVVEFILAWPITVILAFASYRWFEQPFTAKVNTWLRRSSPIS